MASFDVAHIHEQGEDLILIPVDNSFGKKSYSDRNQIKLALQECALNAGLKGTVIPVWLDNINRMNFIAPQNYHTYLKSIDYNFVLMNVNRKLNCL